MSILHMDTDNVRQLAEQIHASIQNLQDNLQRLQNIASGLDWQGANRDQFVQELEQIVRTLSTQFESGHDLSQRVRTEADEWERISTEGSTAFSGIKTTGIAAVAGSMGAVSVAAAAGASATIPSNQAPATPPMPLSSGHVTAVPPYAFAVFSQLAYQDSPTTENLPKNLRDQGWTVFDHDGDPLTGYFGVAYYNTKTKELVFAHRGTQILDPRDLINDAQFFAGLGAGQVYSSMEFVKNVRANLSDQGISTTVHTGHSLGGVVADLSAGLSGTKSITFENPGADRTFSVVDKLKLMNGNLNLNRENFIAYQSNPNPVHLLGENVGYTRQIVPQDGGYMPKITTAPKDLGKTLLKVATPITMYEGISETIEGIKKSSENVESSIKATETRHSIDNIVNSMNPTTGFPKLWFPAEMQGGSHGVFSLDNQEAAKQHGAINAPYTPAREP